MNADPFLFAGNDSNAPGGPRGEIMHKSHGS
jgi:hypothetical protein